MNVTSYEPWSLINLLHQDLDQIVGRKFGLADSNGSSVADWVPAVDIVEEKERFVLRADVPGVKPEDIDVNMEKGVLSLSGERHPLRSGGTSNSRCPTTLVAGLFQQQN